MHLKNLALLKTAEEGADHFASVRFAPAYDAVTTRVFPRLEHDRMALKLNGRDDNLSPEDFEILARTIELPARWAAQCMSTMARSISDAVGTLVLPEGYRLAGDRILDRLRDIVNGRLGPFI